MYNSQNMISTIIENDLTNHSEPNKEISKLLLENKFIDMKWEIVLDDSSSATKNISQIKIKIKIIYMNMTTLKKDSIILLLNEKEFNELLAEMTLLNKNF